VTYAFARLGVADALQPTGSSKTCRELAAALEVRESQIGGKHRCLGAQLKKKWQGNLESAQGISLTALPNWQI